MKHTAAPWVNNGEGHIVHYSGDIARVLSDNPADARLLAAAPDLLAALESLHLAVTMRPSGHGGLSTAERAALDKARAAIAAATH